MKGNEFECNFFILQTFTIQGNPKNGGILPRALDVLFNSIKGKQYDNMNIKPTMYQDVSSLTQEQQHYEEVLKKAVLNAGQKHDIDLSILWKMDTTSQSDLSTISAVSTASSSYVTANDDGKMIQDITFYLLFHFAIKALKYICVQF